MTGAALATYAGLRHPAGFARLLDVCMLERGLLPQAPDVATLLESYQASTGTAQLAHPEMVSSVGFLEKWDQLMSRGGVEAPNSIEDLFDLVENGTLTVGRGDTHFLCKLATDTNTPPYAANGAIRLMGMLAEDSLLPRTLVLPVLKDLLHHDDTQRRYYAVKALWQAMATDTVESMRRRLEDEESPDVLTLMKRAIVALEP